MALTIIAMIYDRPAAASRSAIPGDRERFASMNRKRVYSLDVLKLFLAYVVAYFHSNMEFMPGPTVSVQIFFIISGFFLAKKFYARSFDDHGLSYSAWDYTLDRVRSLYPHYLFSCGILFLYITARKSLDLFRSFSWPMLQEMFLYLYQQIPDIFLVQSAYHWHESLNYPLWQISAMLIAGYFVYGLLCHNEKLSRTLIFPAAILMIQSLLTKADDLFQNYGFFYLPLLRAFYPMCVGVLAFHFTETSYYASLRAHRVLFDFAAISSLVAILCFADYGNIFVITASLLIVNCYDPESVLNRFFDRPCFRWCGKLSYAIFLNHTLIARILWALIVPRMEARAYSPIWAIASLYFLMLTGYSIVTMLLVDRWTSHRKEKPRCSIT